MEIKYMLRDDSAAVITEITNPPEILEIPSVLDGHRVAELSADFIPFGSKSKARQIHLPDTIEKIGVHAFRDMRWLKVLTLPESLTEIADFGIYTCPDLTRLYIPSSVKTFGRCAFGFMYEHGRAYKLNYFTLLCKADAPAKSFALENGLQFEIIDESV